MWWKVDFIWQLATTSSVAGPRSSTKKKSWSLFHYLLPVWSTTAFWTPVKPLHLRNMLTKSTRWSKTAELLQPALVDRKGPILFHNTWLYIAQPTLKKLNEMGYKVLPHPPYSPDVSPTDYHFLQASLQLFAAKTLPQQQEAENVSQEFVESQSMDFYAIGINISCWQKCVDCNGSYFD